MLVSGLRLEKFHCKYLVRTKFQYGKNSRQSGKHYIQTSILISMGFVECGRNKIRGKGWEREQVG